MRKLEIKNTIPIVENKKTNQLSFVVNRYNVLCSNLNFPVSFLLLYILGKNPRSKFFVEQSAWFSKFLSADGQAEGFSNGIALLHCFVC
jgi:hypothetical protein